MTLSAITSSDDLAVVLNAASMTEQDDTETPLDWLAGIWVAGTVYPLDPEATTQTRAVLADGTAAVELSPEGAPCGGTSCTTVAASRRQHWCTASSDYWTAASGARGVTRDWRTVHVWDDNGFSEHTVHDTLELACSAFKKNVEGMRAVDEELAEADSENR